MRSRSNGGVIGAYALPSQNFANGVFFIHDAAIYNTGNNPIWPLGTGIIYSATGGNITTASNNTNYKLHTFTSNGTFTISTGSAYIDILLVGGGGAGGFANNASHVRGGGGAGGQVLLMEQVFVNGPTTFTVEVGIGGTSTTATSANYTTASKPGNPSKVTSGAGYSYTAYGGGPGTGYLGGTGVYTNATSAVSGGGYYTYSGQSSNTEVFPVSTRTTLSTGSPGTVNAIVAASGGASVYTASGYNLVNASAGACGGGGAGATENGYSGFYLADRSLAGAGGNGYLWDRTDKYYGGGGPGGCTYGYPVASYGLKFGLCGGNGEGRLTASNGWAYNNSNLSTSGNGDDGRMYLGGGGQGGASYNAGGNNGAGAKGGAGGTGTVIFCYRYQ